MKYEITEEAVWAVAEQGRDSTGADEGICPPGGEDVFRITKDHGGASVGEAGFAFRNIRWCQLPRGLPIPLNAGIYRKDRHLPTRA